MGRHNSLSGSDPKVLDSPGRLTSIRSGRKMLKGWVCWVPSWTGEVMFPSGTESCYTNSSSTPWWIMRAPHGGPLPASTSGGWRFANQVSSPSGDPWHVSSRQIHGDLAVPLFVEIRALTARFDSKLADVENPLVWQLGRYLRWPRVNPIAWCESQGRQGPAGQSRPSLDEGQVD